MPSVNSGRVVSGMRPSGRLHLGHYHGVLENWLRLQRECECFFFVADWHALTTEYANPKGITANVEEMVVDWLSVGIDPERSAVFLQSSIMEHAELHLILSMITPVPWLERNPTYKEQLTELKDKDIHTYGFLGYPVLQTADIIIYKANKVPVGQDQAPHIELTREITRRFNNFYGAVFPEPETLLTESARVLGTDGRKMSKSYDNAVYLSDPPEVVEKKILTMTTDTARMRRTDTGNPEVCPVFITFHKLYSSSEIIEWVVSGCRSAGIGCIECKKSVIPKVLEKLRPIQEKRALLVKEPDRVRAALLKGNEKARAIAKKTMEEVRRAVGLA